jgi:RNA polymerase sigma-70 factor, ECF subfamily
VSKLVMTVQNAQFNMSEHELVQDAQRGDRAAQRSIYRLYNERVFNIVFYSIGDAVFAEDLTQTIFLKIFRALNGFRFESTLSTWIYRIAINECLNHTRGGGAQYVPLDAILGSGEEMDVNLTPDVEHERNQRQEIIQQAVMELSPKLRAVVVLKYIEGFSYEEIAEVLACSPGTVASRLNRALTNLESRLRPLRKIL